MLKIKVINNNETLKKIENINSSIRSPYQIPQKFLSLACYEDRYLSVGKGKIGHILRNSLIARAK